MALAKVCAWCQQTKFNTPCESCGNPKPKKDIHRSSSTERGYDWKWRKWRKSFIKRMSATGKWDGNCNWCKQPIFKRIHLDHIIPVSGKDDERFFDESNIQFLHEACHSLKTIEDKKNGQTKKTN